MISNLLKPEVIAFIKGHLNDDPFSLSLKAEKLKMDNLQEVILQIQSRQKAQKKLPAFAADFRLVFPKPVSVEQSSSEYTANFKSGLFKGRRFADLTGGMGIDTFYFSKAFPESIYVDSDPQLCELAAHNFSVLGKDDIEVINTTAEQFLAASETHFDLIYLDPSRRDERKKKVFKIEDSFPDVVELENALLNKAENVLIKLSPLVDIKRAFSTFAHLRKVWVVSVKNECKEVLCWLNKGRDNAGQIEAVNILPEGECEIFEFDIADEDKAVPVIGLPMKYIYEPNSSILKAGAFKLVGEKFGLTKLHINTHLYCSDELIAFPGRVFELDKIMKLDKKLISKEFSRMPVNVITRNFHLKPDQLIEKYRLKNGDDKYLIGTTLADTSRVILSCARIK